MTRHITGSVDGPVILSLSDPLASGGFDDPLYVSTKGTIACTGTDTLTGAGLDGIDGAAGTTWMIFNQGTISSADGSGVALAGAGSVCNSGEISACGSGIEIDRYGIVMNRGSVSGQYEGIAILGNGVVANLGSIGSAGIGLNIRGDGEVANQGSIFGFSAGVSLGKGSITNRGTIAAGAGYAVILAHGGSVRNFGGIGAQGGGVWGVNGSTTIMNEGSIESTDRFAFAVKLATGSITNFGTISSINMAVQLGDGEVTNQGSIIGGVEITGGSGTVIDQGLITDAETHPGVSVLFDPATANNLLVIKPGAAFHGAAEATSGTNSRIELAHGSGAISGIGEGQFDGFDTLKADVGANWTLNGANAIGTVLNDGSLSVAGSLDVATAVDPSSTGVFQLAGTATLEVAAALGISSKMSFATGSELVVDNFALFGKNVGDANYAGPLLTNFGGSTIDLAGFDMTGLTSSFSTSSGLLQLTNSESQSATLEFRTSSLGPGSFHFASDGASGIVITHS